MLVAQSCPTLQSHGQQPTRLLCPWDSLSKNTGVGGSSPPRDRTWVSCTAGGFFTNWAAREAPGNIHQPRPQNIPLSSDQNVPLSSDQTLRSPLIRRSALLSTGHFTVIVRSDFLYLCLRRKNGDPPEKDGIPRPGFSGIHPKGASNLPQSSCCASPSGGLSPRFLGTCRCVFRTNLKSGVSAKARSQVLVLSRR